MSDQLLVRKKNSIMSRKGETPARHVAVMRRLARLHFRDSIHS